MSFLREGKANWKFLLIVFVLAVVAGGGILLWQERFMKEEVGSSESKLIFTNIENYLTSQEEEELKSYLIENYLKPQISANYGQEMIDELINQSQFRFFKIKLTPSPKEVIVFFIENTAGSLLERGIAEKKDDSFTVTLFEEDPCYCSSADIYIKKFVNGESSFIVMHFLPHTGSCVAFEITKIYKIGNNEFKDVWTGYNYQAGSGGVEETEIQFEDINLDGDLEILTDTVARTCKACIECEGPVTKEVQFSNIFKWDEVSQEFIEIAIYRNENYGFELDYPKEFATPMENYVYPSNYYCQSKDFCTKDAERVYSIFHLRLDGITVVVFNNPVELSTNEWIQKYLNIMQVQSSEEIKIGGKEGQRLISTNGAIVNTTFVAKGKFVYYISCSYSEPSGELINVLNQILSTFRFLE